MHQAVAKLDASRRGKADADRRLVIRSVWFLVIVFLVRHTFVHVPLILAGIANAVRVAKSSNFLLPR